ncbi:ATP-binding protein [Saccharothrix sp. Mg75]|uniref:ATP-binding protein n=1 Tax=Saccharothrix sp. Mg75 TaxID=3445357 RepID=UPI003EECA095
MVSVKRARHPGPHPQVRPTAATSSRYAAQGTERGHPGGHRHRTACALPQGDPGPVSPAHRVGGAADLDSATPRPAAHPPLGQPVKFSTAGKTMQTAHIRSLMPIAGGSHDVVITAALGADRHLRPALSGRRRVTPERRDRVKAAIRNSDLPYPVTPVSIDSDRFVGSEHPMHDLAVAVAVLTAAGDMPPLQDTIVLGGVTLDGSVRSTPDLWECLRSLRGRTDVHRVIVPDTDPLPALDGVQVLGAATLSDVVAYAHGRRDALTPAPTAHSSPERTIPTILDDVVLSPWVARGLATAVAGGHHVLLTGPDDADRTLFARMLAALLPALTDEQARTLAENRRHDAHADGVPIDHNPPYQAPGRVASWSALAGTSRRPGAALLATHGVLHLTDAARRSPTQWAVIRQIIDKRAVFLDVDGTPTRFTADPLLVLSCVDLASEMRQVPPFIYDRVSVRLHVTHADHEHRPDPDRPEQAAATLPALANSVAAARLRAARRWSAAGVSTNSEIPEDALAMSSVFPRASWELLDRHHRAGLLSRRGVAEVRRVAWSLADLDACDHPESRHVEQAIALRLQSLSLTTT